MSPIPALREEDTSVSPSAIVSWVRTKLGAISVRPQLALGLQSSVSVVLRLMVCFWISWAAGKVIFERSATPVP